MRQKKKQKMAMLIANSVKCNIIGNDGRMKQLNEEWKLNSTFPKKNNSPITEDIQPARKDNQRIHESEHFLLSKK